MKIPSIFLFLTHLFLLFSLLPNCESQNVQNGFLQCLSLRLNNVSGIVSNVIHTPNQPSFFSLLRSSIRNRRFISAPNANPQVIVTPIEESQVPAVVICAKQNGKQIRTRSGGHDYEGLSYTSPIPFVILDLLNLNRVTVDDQEKTAWVEAGATNGQMYYAINQKSTTLAFPAGGCPTVGVGGLFSGGGYGSMLRKHGLAADNIIDARMVDAQGRLLDRKSMGEDVFWAIRGGGAASFGVITAWKLQLVTVPETVAVFSISRTLEQNATDLFHKWQYVAPYTSKDLIISVNIEPVYSGRKTIQVSFSALFQGRVDQLLELLEKSFPELGLRREDCAEVSWIQGALFYGGYSVQQSPQVLTSRNPEIPSAIRATRFSFKAKLDYVKKPIPKPALRGMWKLLLEREPDTSELIVVPYGGRMGEISDSAIPFPHRAGNLFKIQQLAYWNQSGTLNQESRESVSWVRKFYGYMTPYVSKFPRTGYINYRDLDLGVNSEGNTSYAQASIWGFRYFKNNFKRLVEIKSKIDPTNFFRNEQSIPVIYSKGKN